MVPLIPFVVLVVSHYGLLICFVGFLQSFRIEAVLFDVPEEVDVNLVIINIMLWRLVHVGRTSNIFQKRVDYNIG